MASLAFVIVGITTNQPFFCWCFTPMRFSPVSYQSFIAVFESIPLICMHFSSLVLYLSSVRKCQYWRKDSDGATCLTWHWWSFASDGLLMPHSAYIKHRFLLPVVFFIISRFFVLNLVNNSSQSKIVFMAKNANN